MHFNLGADRLLQLRQLLLLVEAGPWEVILVEVSDVSLENAVYIICKVIELSLLGDFEGAINISSDLLEQVLFLFSVLPPIWHL